jgi:hypothetical protein
MVKTRHGNSGSKKENELPVKTYANEASSVTSVFEGSL